MLTDTTHADLLSIIERETGLSFPTLVQNFRDGAEYQGPCPFCSANNSGKNQDRFHIWPDAMLPHYWCRQCGKFGDAISFYKDFKGLFYSEACQELGIEPGQQYLHKRSGTPALSDDGPPSSGWQEMAENIAARAEKYLWTDAGKPAREYLHARGLRDETIKSARLGYFPLDSQGIWYSRPFTDWGLDPEQLTEPQRDKGCVKVPDGLLIPWRADGQLWKLTVKRFQAKSNELKYGQILGSKECLYNSDAIRPDIPALLCEKITDWLSVQQEAGNLVTCVSVDGARSCQHVPRILARLSLAPSLLIGFDVDENKAGEHGAAFWLDIFPHAARLVPWLKDINDMLKAGKDIRRWVSMGLSLVTERATEPLVIVHPCFCGQPGTFQDRTSPATWWCGAHDSAARYVDPDPGPTTCCMCSADIDQVDDGCKGYCQFHYEQVFLVPASFKARPCAHCGGYEAKRDEDGRWMCLCWFDASLRRPYSWQPGGKAQPKDWSSYW